MKVVQFITNHQAGIQISTESQLRKRSESEIFFEKKCEAKAKRTPNFFLRSEAKRTHFASQFFAIKRKKANSLRFAIFRKKAKKAKIFANLFLYF